ncbi:hypothetical protein [Clostridium sp. 'White wine YQ']|uniref:hypothetical protein n=1 Tax=Clostridium sp. 'White wine YQ' TaxID=3027474 RepID=UPI0023661EB4|nr:hypothetical protein [Clostridium sp. 'White wine YQ']MDD7793718.1 hypothetical protein [Clostridium sp. 'White wine YQ']
MNIKKFLLLFLISIFTFVEFPQAQVQPPPIANTYKQGIYDISHYSGKFITSKLTTPDAPVTVIVLDSNGNQKVLLRSINPNEIVKLGPIKEGDLMVIVGSGEISFSPVQ